MASGGSLIPDLLAPGLDPRPFATRFAARSRVRIPGFLRPEAADRLYACLSRETPWELAYNDGETVHKVGPAGPPIGPAQQQEAMRGILRRARHDFQFLYSVYPILDAYLEGRNPGHLLHSVLEWINSPDTLDFVRAVTGIPEIVKGDAQATWYQPGHFLTLHDDTGTEAEHRRCAFVINLSRDWRADWGGLLHFYGNEGQAVTETWVPDYNVLALFRVPVRHSVSYVSPFAGGPRFGITGWFKDA